MRIILYLYSCKVLLTFKFLLIHENSKLSSTYIIEVTFLPEYFKVNDKYI
jgi:hypothetical protein